MFFLPIVVCWRVNQRISSQATVSRTATPHANMQSRSAPACRSVHFGRKMRIWLAKHSPCSQPWDSNNCSVRLDTWRICTLCTTQLPKPPGLIKTGMLSGWTEWGHDLATQWAKLICLRKMHSNHSSNFLFLPLGCVHGSGNMAMFQTGVLFLELQLKESTVNERDRCCSTALMVVFQCAAEPALHGSFVKRPASACCQAPLVLLITHDKVMVKWGQLAWAETAWTEGEWWVCVHRIDL